MQVRYKPLINLEKPFSKFKKKKNLQLQQEKRPETFKQNLISKVSYDIIKSRKDLHKKSHRMLKVSFV